VTRDAGGGRAAPPIRVLAEGRFLRFVDDGGWEYVTRPNATGVVVIVAVTPDDRLILVEQLRPAVRARVVELPAGLAGDIAPYGGEPLEAAAHRELVEETGYAADEMVRLAEGPVAVGVASEVVTFFHARGLRRVGPGGGDANESITVHEVPLKDLRAWLSEKQKQGAMVDPKLFAGLYLISEPR